jgi:oligopeptide transport system substrate-binding protein
MEMLETYKVLEDKNELLTYYFIETKDLQTSKDLLCKLSIWCNEIQSKVWSRKFSSDENSIHQDFLVLTYCQKTKRFIGFVSSSLFDFNNSTIGLYFSDAMIDTQYQNSGVCKKSVLITNNFLNLKYKKKILNLIVTGYIHIFRIFEENTSFEKLPFDKLLYQKAIQKKLEEDYEISDLETNGVIKNAWNKQTNSMKDCWNKSLVEQYAFPNDVDYFNGDVLVRIYLFDNSDQNTPISTTINHKKKFTLNTTALHLILILFVFLNGCIKQKINYKKGLSSKVITIDPRKARDRQDYMLMRNVYGQFLFEDQFGEVKPQAIENWEVTNNGTLYKFRVSKNIQFHSGRNLSCEDLKFSINFLAQKNSLISKLFSSIQGYEEYSKGKTKTLSGVHCLDNLNLEVKLSRKSFIFLTNLADPKVIVLPFNLNNLTETDFFNKPDGIGPYIAVENPSGKNNFKFIKNNNYFGTLSNIDEFHFTYMEKSQALNQFNNNEIMDLEMYQFDTSEIEEFKRKSHVFSSASFANTFIFFNGRKKLFQDIKIRKQLQNLIDQKEFERTCNRNLISSSGVIPYGVMGWSEGEKITIGKVTRKSNNLTQPTELKLVTYGPKVADCVLSHLKTMLESDGSFKITFLWKNEMDATSAFVNGEYDLWYDVLSVRGKEPYNLFTFFDSNSAHNITFFNDIEIGNKLIEIESSLGALRNQKYTDLSRYIVQEKSYVIPLFSDLRIYIFNKRIKFNGNPAFILGLSTMNQVNL